MRGPGASDSCVRGEKKGMFINSLCSADSTFDFNAIEENKSGGAVVVPGLVLPSPLPDALDPLEHNSVGK